MAYNTPFTEDAVDATITVSAEGTPGANQRAISIQLKDAAGNNMDAVSEVELIMFLNSGGSDFVATGGSTGIAIGASGKLLTIVAKKFFRALTTSAGLLALTWTDTGTEAAFLGVKLPNGRIVMSSALTNA